MPRKKELKIPEPRLLTSGNYFIQLRINGKSISITENDYNVCKARARAIKAGIIEEKNKPKSITVGKAVDNYIDSKSEILSPSTIKAYRSYRNARFLSLYDVNVDKLTKNQLQKAVNAEMTAFSDTGKKLSPKTIINSYRLIETAIKDMVNFNISDISLPRWEPQTGRSLTTDEIKILLGEIQKSYCEVPLLLALWLGLRRGEIIALKKADFDFERNTVTISKAMVQGSDKKWVEKSPKTKAGRRTIACPAYILDKIRGMPDTGYLFTMHPNSIYLELQKICKRANIPHTRLHDLRHTSASIGLLLNIPGKYMQERGGWSSPSVMSKIYQHTLTEEAAAVGQKFDNFFTSLLHENANDNANKI